MCSQRFNLAVWFAVGGLWSVAASGDEVRSEARLITVTGSAEVRVVPDEVIITLGVETLDMDINKAKRESDERVAKVFQITERYGIPEKRLQTDHVSIGPEYAYENRRSVFKGYAVRQTIAVTLRDISVYEPLLTELVKGNVNRVRDVQFRVVNSRPHKDEARIMAIQAAKEKATALAGALGQTIGLPHSITEETRDTSYAGRWSGRAQVSANTFTENLEGAATDVGLALGQIVVSARVTVCFELQTLSGGTQ